MKIKIFTVGGTIDKVYFDKLSEYQIGHPGIEKILHDLPVTFEYEIEALMRKDSLDMTDEDRKLLADKIKNSDCDRILVTHGTDTMADSAQYIKHVDDKVVVFTGALEPFGFKSSDAVFNIGTALGAINTAKNGVYIAMNGIIFEAGSCKKNRAQGRFEIIEK